MRFCVVLSASVGRGESVGELARSYLNVLCILQRRTRVVKRARVNARRHAPTHGPCFGRSLSLSLVVVGFDFGRCHTKCVCASSVRSCV